MPDPAATCMSCERLIEPHTFPDESRWSALALAAFSQTTYGWPLCWSCYARMEASARRQQGAVSLIG
jgi:hypothetical protein